MNINGAVDSSINVISGEINKRKSVSGNISQISSKIDICSGEISGVLNVSGNIQTDGNIGGNVTFPCPEQHEDYEGSYIVTPKKNETILLTRDKLLTNDVIVLEVPYAAVSNQKGGYTVTIL